MNNAYNGEFIKEVTRTIQFDMGHADWAKLHSTLPIRGELSFFFSHVAKHLTKLLSTHDLVPYDPSNGDKLLALIKSLRFGDHRDGLLRTDGDAVSRHGGRSNPSDNGNSQGGENLPNSQSGESPKKVGRTGRKAKEKR